MKWLVALCVFAVSVVAFDVVQPPQLGGPRGCVVKLRKCVRECEEGTHAYSTGCGPLTPEATCDVPNPREGRTIMCEFSECYCDPPTVRDTVSGKCVPLEQCPKK